MSPERKAVVVGLPLGLLMTTGGLAVALTASGGDVPLGATVMLMGLGFLLSVAYLALPRRPVVPRTEGDAVVIDGSRWPWRFLLVATVGATAAAVLGTAALLDPAVLAGSSGRRSPLALLVLWPLAGWLWFALARGRTRQRVEVRGDEVTLHAGRSRTTVTARRRAVRTEDGHGARRQSVVVRGRADRDELVLPSRLYGTTPEHLADAVRAALPR